MQINPNQKKREKNPAKTEIQRNRINILKIDKSYISLNQACQVIEYPFCV